MALWLWFFKGEEEFLIFIRFIEKYLWINIFKVRKNQSVFEKKVNKYLSIIINSVRKEIIKDQTEAYQIEKKQN